MSSLPEPVVSTPPSNPPSADVKQRRREDLPLRDMDWFGSFLGGLRRGGVYLLGGSPGSRKSGLGLQLALDLARQGMRSLFLLSEETAERLYDRSFPMMSDWSANDLCGGIAHISAEVLMATADLPQFVAQKILAPGGKWNGSTFPLVVIDSIQGNGLPSTSTRHYQGLIQAARSLAAAGITCLLISHTTKDGRLAGPGAIEHAVDVVMVIKKTALGRALFVTKNRFGPAHLNDPLLLKLDDATLRLSPSQHAVGNVAVARSYIGAANAESSLIDVQASVTLAAYGSRGRLSAAGIPTVEVDQILTALSWLDGIHLSDSEFSISVRVPGRRPYLSSMGLALATALIGAHLQRPVPLTNLYLGEIDLAGAIRPVDNTLANMLASDIDLGMELSEPRTIFCHPRSALLLRGTAPVKVCACEHLKQVVFTTWTELR